MALTQQVIVNGVTVEMFDDTKPSKMRPMRATVDWHEEMCKRYDFDGNPEMFQRLRNAGVKLLPLYKSEAEGAGIEWQEIG